MVRRAGTLKVCYSDIERSSGTTGSFSARARKCQSPTQLTLVPLGHAYTVPLEAIVLEASATDPS